MDNFETEEHINKIYVSEDVYNQLKYDALLLESYSIIGKCEIVVKKDLPENTIMTLKPEEVKKYYKDKFVKMKKFLEDFENFYKKC